MQQRDCGCGKIISPTLDELLAVARKKPLPTMRVRERRPSPARVAASMRGWVRWGLIDRAGREVKGGEGPNLITDQGLDQIASVAIIARQGNTVIPAVGLYPIIGYGAVGTDNTAPDPTDTGLGSEVGRTNATYASDEIVRTAPGVYQITKHIEFDYGEANGNLTEWGFSNSSSAGSNLFNRALFLDGGGSPDPVTKTSDYKLRLAYTLEATLSPVSWTAGSFTITGVGTMNGDYTLVGGDAPTSATARCIAPDLAIFSRWAMGEMGTLSGISSRPTEGKLSAWGADLSALNYAYNSTFNLISGSPASDSNVEARDAYVPGSFERTGGKWKWDTANGNLDPIAAFVAVGAYDSYNSGISSCGPYAGYVFDLDLANEFTKDNEHTLTIGVPTVTWARGS